MSKNRVASIVALRLVCPSNQTILADLMCTPTVQVDGRFISSRQPLWTTQLSPSPSWPRLVCTAVESSLLSCLGGVKSHPKTVDMGLGRLRVRVRLV